MKPLRVLIGCECSGVVRRAFRDLGHDAWSCDLKDAEDASPYHIKGDLLEAMHFGWDLAVMHPVCKYLANSGSKHLYTGMKKENGRNEDRWEKMRAGARFFRQCWDAPIARLAVENPVIHGHALKLIGVRQTQTIQPWMFGHLEVKRTCLWLRGLPKLVETDNVYDEMMKLTYAERARVHHMAPGPEREADRSRTYEGIARAMAAQWSDAIERDLFARAA